MIRGLALVSKVAVTLGQIRADHCFAERKYTVPLCPACSSEEESDDEDEEARQ